MELSPDITVKGKRRKEKNFLKLLRETEINGYRFFGFREQCTEDYVSFT